MSSPPSPRATLRRALVLVPLAVVAACASTPDALDFAARRYDGVDVCRREISTDSAEAQAWFDQGLTLLYGFNFDEARRSFAEAARLDPDCTMAWWGLAHSSGTDVNDPSMTEEECRVAYDAAMRAVRTSGDKTPLEAALAYAEATRFAWPPPEDRKELDEAYAVAMGDVYARYGDNPDVATLYAESLMLLTPWEYWDEDLKPKGRVPEAIAALERALGTEPDHAGACHFLVHALEVGDPRRAEAAADLLAERVPGSGHLLHMPSHIYVHIGRYADGADCNERAVAADHAYFEAGAPEGNYMGYYAHNVHMLAYCAMMEGRERTATDAAAELDASIPEDFIRENPAWVDGLMSTGLHVAVRFGRWDEILETPEPPSFRKMSVAQWHYARGVAFSATGRTEEARRELAAFERAKPEVPEDWLAGANPATTVLELAHAMLKGELLWREGRAEEAFAELRAGVEAEDAMHYDEPPGWMQPVRHALGALLMADGRAEEAEAVYRADLERNPGNGWSLLGLEQALTAQGRLAEAATFAAEKDRAWARADMDATSSCFCEPGGGGDASAE